MIEVRTYNAISEIGAERWNRLRSNDYPFLSYEFLYALEASGAVSTKSGWQPIHIEISENSETLILMPLYLKHHSWGEYVFDHSWADAYSRNGLTYYPKLLTAIPFTPSTGPRWLTKLPNNEAYPYITSAVEALANEHNLSGWHLLFPESLPQESSDLLIREGVQYHWFNRDYQSFDHYLDQLKSRKRKEIRKERNRTAEFDFIHLNGNKISDEQLKLFYHFYALTYFKRGRNPYLPEAFFRQLCETMPEQLLFVFAYLEENAVAAALSLQDSETLYGRYWGCEDEYHSLHFETCYYQGLDHCIVKRLKRFDPGAQGEHKIQRGFEPITTHSVHFIAHPQFREVIGEFCNEERDYLAETRKQLAQYLPFKLE